MLTVILKSKKYDIKWHCFPKYWPKLESLSDFPNFYKNKKITKMENRISKVLWSNIL